MTVAAVHAAVFGIIFFFIHTPVYKMVRSMEGMDQPPSATVQAMADLSKAVEEHKKKVEEKPKA